jgi:serine/threonine protein kinase
VDQKRLGVYLVQLRDTSLFSRQPTKVADYLVRDGILTGFQAEHILQGKWRGFTIGRYTVLGRLGAGKQATVYLCQDAVLQRRVAIKVLPSAMNVDPVSVKRFFRECQILAGLDHPNIVRPFELGRDEKMHYMALEYVDGSPLEQIVEKHGPMNPTRAAHYIRQAALALQHLCDRGVVHRDLKPSDILVDRSGSVKIIDMGLARFCRDEQTISPTKPGEVVLGTPDYMAPEQVAAYWSVDHRADIYGLGATFYFCLTRSTPFQNETVAQKLKWHQTRQPEPIRMLRPNVPEGLVALIERMMAKRPSDRPQTAQEVADVLLPYTRWSLTLRNH